MEKALRCMMGCGKTGGEASEYDIQAGGRVEGEMMTELWTGHDDEMALEEERARQYVGPERDVLIRTVEGRGTSDCVIAAPGTVARTDGTTITVQSVPSRVGDDEVLRVIRQARIYHDTTIGAPCSVAWVHLGRPGRVLRTPVACLFCGRYGAHDCD